MTNNEVNVIKKIKKQYEERKTEKAELERLKELDKKAKKPALVFSYTLGTVGALVLGTGMTMAMSLIPGGMIAGVAIGCCGILVDSFNYPLHKKIMKSRREKYSKEILELSNKILNEEK